jgi:hypothetical protein
MKKYNYSDIFFIYFIVLALHIFLILNFESIHQNQRFKFINFKLNLLNIE